MRHTPMVGGLPTCLPAMKRKEREWMIHANMNMYQVTTRLTLFDKSAVRNMMMS